MSQGERGFIERFYNLEKRLKVLERKSSKRSPGIPSPSPNTGAGARFHESTGASIATTSVIVLPWNNTTYSYGKVSERPSLGSGGNINVPPGIWAITLVVRLTGSGILNRIQATINEGSTVISAIEHPVNVATNPTNVSAVLRNTSSTTIHATTFQDSGNTKSLHDLSYISVNRLAPIN